MTAGNARANVCALRARVQIRGVGWVLAVVAAVLVGLGCRPEVTKPGAWGPETERELVALQNAERAAAGLPAYRVDWRLELAAAVRVADMVNGNYASHRDPDGEPGEYWEILLGWELSWVWAGENLVTVNYEDPAAAAVELMMGSKSHRANVLDANYDAVGCAAWHGEHRKTWMVCIYAWGLE